jgi:hypothetical protein
MSGMKTADIVRCTYVILVHVAKIKSMKFFNVVRIVKTKNSHNFHYQLLAECFYICYTKLLKISAIYPGHLQGAASLFGVYSLYGN